MEHQPSMFLKLIVFAAIFSFVSSKISPPQCEYEVFQVLANGKENKSSTLKLGNSLDLSSCPYYGFNCPERNNRHELVLRQPWLTRLSFCCSRDQEYIGFSATSNTKMRIKCEAPYPLDMKFEQPGVTSGLPYSGMKVRFSARISPAKKNQIELEFPEIMGIENESIANFNGKIQFFNIQNRNVRTTVNLAIKELSSHPNDPVRKELSLTTRDDQAVCISSNLRNGEIYFAGVGGDNPRESELQRACLEKKNTCANKVLGTTCVRDRFCQKILRNIHQNGILSCQDDSTTTEKHYFAGLDLDTHNVPANLSESNINARLLIQVYEDDNKRVKDILAEFPHGDEVKEIKENEKFENKPKDPFNVTVGNRYTFECHFVPYLLIQPIIWTVTLDNGSTIKLPENGSHIEYRKVEGSNTPLQIKIKSSKAKVDIARGMAKISCSAFYWNSQDQVSSSRDLDVVDVQTMTTRRSDRIKNQQDQRT